MCGGLFVWVGVVWVGVVVNFVISRAIVAQVATIM